MKTLLSILLLTGLSLAAQAQTATNLNLRCIVNLDDGSRTTNGVNISGVRLQGLQLAHAENTKTRTDAKLAPLTLDQFVFQEVRDKGAEWVHRGIVSSSFAIGLTNARVKLTEAQLGELQALTDAEKIGVVRWLNKIGE